MEYLCSGVTSLAVALLAYLLQHALRENHALKQERMTESQAIKEGMLCLLRVKMIEYHAKYMAEESISTHGYENWSLMYKAYKALGGNGMVDHLKQDLDELKTRI